MYVWGEVRRWRAEPLGVAGDGLAADIRALERARDAVEQESVPASWTGFARFMAQVQRQALLAALERHLSGKRGMRRGLYDAERQVAEIERLVLDVEGQARADQLTVAHDGTVSDASTPPTVETRWEAEEWRSVRQGKIQAVVDDISAILVRAAAADATIVDSIPPGHVTEIDEYGAADPDVAARWAQLTDAERRAVIRQMITELAEESGLEMPEIVWEPDTWGPNGSWADGEPGTLRLNEGLLDDPRILHTVAHEVRHGRQYEAIRDADDWRWPWQDDPFDEHRDDGITEQQAKTWKDNFDDYQSTSNPGTSYEDYFTQPVEDDARDSGREFLDGLTEAELERYRQEAR